MLAASSQSVGICCLIRQVEILLEEAGSLTNWNRFCFVDTEHLSDVFAVEAEIRNHAQLVEALQRHQQHETYGRDSFHGLKVVKSVIRKT